MDAKFLNELPPDNYDQAVEDGLLYRIFERSGDPAQFWSQMVNQTRMAMTISDPNQPDNPIIYANRAFSDLTGYSREEVIGRNCRFLQGQGSGIEKIAAIRNLIERQKTGIVELLNYRKDGTPFWNALHIGPIYNRDGQLAYFFGSQWNADEQAANKSAAEQFETVTRELNHRLMNIFAVVSALVSMSANESISAIEAATKTRERINALGNVHRATLDWSAQNEAMGIVELLRLVLKPYEGERSSLDLDGQDTHLPVEVVSPLGMALHELATNSLRFGFLGGKAHTGRIVWKRLANFDDGTVKLHLEWREAFKATPGEDSIRIGAGSRIMQAMLIQLGGSIVRTVSGNELVATIEVPLLGRDPELES